MWRDRSRNYLLKLCEYNVRIFISSVFLIWFCGKFTRKINLREANLPQLYMSLSHFRYHVLIQIWKVLNKLHQVVNPNRSSLVGLLRNKKRIFRLNKSFTLYLILFKEFIAQKKKSLMWEPRKYWFLWKFYFDLYI